MVITLTLAAASLWAALPAFSRMAERFGSAPILSVPGSSVPFAGQTARTYAAALTAKHAGAHAVTAVPNAAVRKVDDRARPRGRRL